MRAEGGPPGAITPTIWRHPHEAFHHAIGLYLAATLSPNGKDTGRLILGLWSYVEGMIDETPHAPAFSRAWNVLAEEFERYGSSTGVRSGMTPDEFEARQISIIVRFAKLAGMFDSPDTSFGRAQLAREVEKFRGVGE